MTKTPSKTDDKSGAPAHKGTGPFEYVQQVRQETAKVTWPSRKETTVTTIMVVFLAILAAVFFFLVDQVIGLGVAAILNLRN
ncbi:MAG: preprotein translocase subunit SecE [Alphaproteobacteria bacterium]